MYLGRADECDIVLPSVSVSRRHAVILFKDGICGVKDLASFNGTLLNDRPVHSPQHLTEHDILKISSFIIRFQMKRRADAPDASATPSPPANPNSRAATVAIENPDKPRRSDSKTYFDSNLLLPRAMLDELRNESAYAVDQFDDADFTDPTVTRFFMTPPPLRPVSGEAMDDDELPEDVPISLAADAESAIPLIEPEETLVLTFAADPESDAADPEAAADKPQPNALAMMAGEIAPVPLECDAAGLEHVPVSGEMEARIEERLALYADSGAVDEDRVALPRVFKACYALAGDEPLARELHAAGVSHGRLFGCGLYLLVLRDMLAGSAGNAARREALESEAAAMEQMATEEFRRAYLGACVHFLPEHESMPEAVRAFLRHGMVGAGGWWLRREVRDFILRDCRDHAPLSVQFAPAGAVVLYAEEYLAAVAEMECAPTPNPRLESQEWLTVDRLADRCYRRIVNAGSYNIRLKGLITEMEDRLRAAGGEHMAPPSGGPAWDRQVLRHQLERIKTEIMDSILEAVQQAEGRFRRGEVRMPKQEDLIRGETAAFLGIGPNMADGERVFMPLALRERFPLQAGVVNDRESLRSAVARLEARQPEVFSRVLNPHDRRDEQLRLRLPPLFIIHPTSGRHCYCGLESRGMDGGHIFVPLCYSSRGIGEASLAAVLLEYSRRGEAASTAPSGA